MSTLKNTLIIEVDSEADTKIIISKPENTKKPETVKETVEMMSVDFKTLCVAICEMSYVGHVNGYFNGNEVLNNCVKEIENYKSKLIENLENNNNENL